MACSQVRVKGSLFISLYVIMCSYDYLVIEFFSLNWVCDLMCNAYVISF